MQQITCRCFFAYPSLPCSGSYIHPSYLYAGGRNVEKISTGQGHVFLKLSAAKEYIPTGQGQNYLQILGHELKVNFLVYKTRLKKLSYETKL
jgi:hypothetical protein